MSDFKYRELNFSNESEIRWAAQNYCENPSYWESNWIIDQSALERQVSRISEAADDKSQMLLVAESPFGDRIAGP